MGTSVFSGRLLISIMVRLLALWSVPYCVAVFGSHFWFGRGFGSSAASCLDISCRVPPLAIQILPLLFGLAVWFCCLTNFSLTCLDGDGATPSFVDVVGSHFWFRRGFGSRDASCMTIPCRLPLLVRQPFPLCLGFYMWCCHPTACLLTFLGVDVVSPSRVTAVGITCGSVVVSARALPVVWMFRSLSLLLCVSLFLLAWGLTCGTVFQRLAS